MEPRVSKIAPRLGPEVLVCHIITMTVHNRNVPNKHVEKRYIAYFGGFTFILKSCAVGKITDKLLSPFFFGL